MRLSVVLLFSAIYLLGCCKAECINGELITSFENFRARDIDTILLIRYQQGSQQQTIIDTTYSVRSTGPNDTFNIHHTEQLFYPFDWKIVIPGLNKQYIVSDFQLETVRCCGEKAKRVSSFKLNNAQQAGDFLKLQ